MESIYANSIDTDMGIATILSNFDSDYIYHVIGDSLQIKFRPFDEPMPNYPDILERNFNGILVAAPDYKDQIQKVRAETYREIIDKICDYYDLTFEGNYDDIDQMELYGITHTLYDIFISRFTDHMIDMFMRYIIENSGAIYAYLMNEYNNGNRAIVKPKEKELSRQYIDPKYIMIHANINLVIRNMTSYDIPLNVLFGFFTDPATADRLSMLISDNNDIFKNHYASYINDPRYMAEVLTVIKLKLQSKTMQALQINTTGAV